MSEPLVEVIVEAPEWQRHLPDLEEIAAVAVEAALRETGLGAEDFSVALLACDDARIAGLNAAFRGREGPTNVLSWPAFSLTPERPGAAPILPVPAQPGGRTPLGDVAVSLETVLREAKSEGKPLKNHAMHLILHGCLHLLGFDHESPEDADLMEGIERAVLARIGIPDPYA